MVLTVNLKMHFCVSNNLHFNFLGAISMGISGPFVWVCVCVSYLHQVMNVAVETHCFFCKFFAEVFKVVDWPNVTFNVFEDSMHRTARYNNQNNCRGKEEDI